jgi:hypothetical protein
MLCVGQTLTIGLVPVTIACGLYNWVNANLPWSIFVGGLVALFTLGIGMLIGKSVLARGYDPNDRDVEARKQLGQSRARLLREQVILHRLDDGLVEYDLNPP